MNADSDIRKSGMQERNWHQDGWQHVGGNLIGAQRELRPTRMNGGCER
jgi:hypothetical protein